MIPFAELDEDFPLLKKGVHGLRQPVVPLIKNPKWYYLYKLAYIWLCLLLAATIPTSPLSLPRLWQVFPQAQRIEKYLEEALHLE